MSGGRDRDLSTTSYYAALYYPLPCGQCRVLFASSPQTGALSQAPRTVNNAAAPPVSFAEGRRQGDIARYSRSPQASKHRGPWLGYTLHQIFLAGDQARLPRNRQLTAVAETMAAAAPSSSSSSSARARAPPRPLHPLARGGPEREEMEAVAATHPGAPPMRRKGRKQKQVRTGHIGVCLPASVCFCFVAAFVCFVDRGAGA